MQNPKFVQVNETHKLLWDFDIQTDHQISARRLDLIVINNKKWTCRNVNFAVPADHRVRLKESKKKNKYLDLARELKKIVEHENDSDTSYNKCFWYSHQRIVTKTGGLEEIMRRVETVQITALLRSKLLHFWKRPEYWEESWRLEETFSHSNFSERSSADADLKNSHWE